MIVAAYMPSWEGAAWALPGQCMVVGALAAALFFYARQRHGTPRSAVALAVGSLVGLMIGLGWALRGWRVKVTMVGKNASSLPERGFGSALIRNRICTKALVTWYCQPEQERGVHAPREDIRLR